MDRVAWWATVHEVTKRVRHDLVTKEKQQNKMDFEAILLSEINQTEKSKYYMYSLVCE